MSDKHFRLNKDQVNQRSYSTIDYCSDTTILEREESWVKRQCNRFLGSDRLVIIHEKQRAYRRRHGTIHTFFISMMLFLVVLFGARALLNSDIFEATSHHTSDENWVDLIKEIASSDSIRELFLHSASRSHLASSSRDEELAEWTRKKFTQFGLKNASIETYYPYLNYPIQRKLAIVSGPEQLLFQASLKETKDPNETPTFHAYSASGNVTGPIVYVNYGRLEDFALLANNSISTKGAIALFRHGVIPSSIKIQNAEAYGCIGALVYTDPLTKKKNTATLPSSLVHRESVQRNFIYPGDPYTPGYAATLNSTRNETASYNLPRIPSLPISWDDALPLLRATQDLGFVEPAWVGGGKKQVGYFTGPSIAQCNLVNFNEFEMKPIWNVLGHITGHEEPEKVIIIGNHRDAFSYGAADPSSGSAVMLELARVLGVLLKQGWKPRRSIILASWDAKEYGNVGSTEWVEDHLPWLDKNAVVYLNVGRAVTGPHFSAEASPLLNRLLVDVTSMVIDPRTSKSVYEAWLDRFVGEALERDDDDEDFIDPLIQPIGQTPGLDSLAFFEHVGISSLSMSFDGDNYGLSHSAFDTISWMEEVGDPTFEYHQTMVRIWGLLALRLSSDVVLPLYPIDYALAMKHHLAMLTPGDHSKPTKDIQTMKHHHKDDNNNNNSTEPDFSEIESALKSFYKSTIKFNTKIQALRGQVAVNTKKSNKKIAKQIKRANERLVKLERVFVQNEGLLVNRPWYKHAIFAPSAKTGLVDAFPSLVESKDLEQVDDAQKLLADILQNAKSVLLKGKTKHNHFVSNEEEEVIF